MSAVLEPVAAICRTVPLTEAVELNPKLDRGSLSDDLEVSFVAMAAVEAGTGGMDATMIRRYAEVKKGYTYFREGDVLFAKITPCMENGKMAVARLLRNGVGFGSTEFHVLRPRKGVDPYYVYHLVSSARFRAKAAHNMTGAVGQKRVQVAFLEQSEIPLPLIDEQRRIVAEIEKQFSRLDGSITNLQRVKAKLKRHKTAVLKAAVEGRLVPTESELARLAGREYESGEQLLQRIRDERRTKWKGKGRYKDPAAPDTQSFTGLPKGWTWATAEQCTSVITDGEHITPERTESGVLLLSARNVRDGHLSLDEVDFVPRYEYERIARRLVINPGDVLLSCSGSVGRSTVVPEGVEFTLVRSVAVLKPLVGMGKYISLALRSPILKQQISGKKTQTAQANIFQGKIKTLCIPLPPYLEQLRIVGEVERLLSVSDSIEGRVDDALRRTARLRQAALTFAFAPSSKG